MEDDVNLVGVYGMGGVGKTTLVKQVREEIENMELFDIVVLATVSQNAQLFWIQTQIAESLGLKYDVETIPARANILAEVLRHGKKILLILDDLWTRLELHAIGIILGGTDEYICKVLITTRNLDVCRSMGCKINVEVKTLSHNDSLKLFQQEVGDLDCDAKHEMSKEIAIECKGLPLAIVTLARSLICKAEGVWRAVIPQLKKSMLGGMFLVTSSIELSYNFLEASETKQLFLVCSMFPEDYMIHKDLLIGYAMGESLLGDAETLRETRGNLEIMVDTLISSGLLLKVEDKLCVKMHDIVRDTAIYLALKNGNSSILKAGLGLNRWPKVNAWRGLRLSLMENDICEIPNTLKYSQLMTLSLARNRNLKNIPYVFFEDMKCLATLDLSVTGISSLPQSLSSLKHCLQSLYLDGCMNLKDFCGIGSLKTLEILSLRKTNCQTLPEEIKGLANLKLLDLCGSASLTCVPPKVISSLSNLEELDLHNSFSGWEIERMRDGSNANLVELTSLAYLSSLHLELQDSKILSIDIGRFPWEKLQNFAIKIGSAQFGDFYYYTLYRHLALQTSANSYPFADWVLILMERTYELLVDLNGCEGIKNVLHLKPNGFPNLNYLLVDNSDTMEYIVDTNYKVPERVFPQLKTLNIARLRSLKAIWNGPFLEGSFEELSSLSIDECVSLVNILPHQ